MIDLHCHILPNVDDGPRSLDESLQMAAFCVMDGITHVTATPHCHRHIHLLRADIIPRVADLNREVVRAGIPLNVLPGSEIQVFDSDEYRREFEEGLFCYLGDGSSFTLLEFNWSGSQFPPDAAELIEWIRERRMTPIIAHPERHDFFRKDPSLLQGVVDAGAWIQITVDSLLGNFGPDAAQFAETFLKAHEMAVLATDAHNQNRCSGLSAGYAWVSQNLGESRAHDLRARAEQVLNSL